MPGRDRCKALFATSLPRGQARWRRHASEPMLDRAADLHVRGLRTCRRGARRRGHWRRRAAPGRSRASAARPTVPTPGMRTSMPVPLPVGTARQAQVEAGHLRGLAGRRRLARASPARPSAPGTQAQGAGQPDQRCSDRDQEHEPSHWTIQSAIRSVLGTICQDSRDCGTMMRYGSPLCRSRPPVSRNVVIGLPVHRSFSRAALLPAALTGSQPTAPTAMRGHNRTLTAR